MTPIPYEVLGYLHQTHRVRYLRSPLEVRMEGMMWRITKAAGVFGLACAVMIGWHVYAFPLPAIAQRASLVLAQLAFAASGLAIIPMILGILPTFFPSRQLVFQRFIRSAEDFEEHVAALAVFDTDELQRAKTVLENETGLTRHWISLISGSPDKLALLGLASIIPAIVASLLEQVRRILGLDEKHLGYYIVPGLLCGAGVVFLLSLARAAGLASQLRRYSFQIELINTALARRIQDAPAS